MNKANCCKFATTCISDVCEWGRRQKDRVKVTAKTAARSAYLSRWHTYRRSQGRKYKQALTVSPRDHRSKRKRIEKQNGKRGSEVNYAVPNTETKRKEEGERERERGRGSLLCFVNPTKEYSYTGSGGTERKISTLQVQLLSLCKMSALAFQPKH